jgi:CheY-like chemotaxis protein
VEASDGQEALVRIEENHPPAILTDLLMACMAGIVELTRFTTR